MDVRIASGVLEQVIAAAAASPAREVCGLLFGGPGRIDTAVACANVAADPACRFEIDPAALLAAHRDARGGGTAIAGCYHSHPHGVAVPSACDADAATGDGALWLIVAGGVARLWRTDAPGRFEEVRLAPRDSRGQIGRLRSGEQA